MHKKPEEKDLLFERDGSYALQSCVGRWRSQVGAQIAVFAGVGDAVFPC